MIGFDWLPPVAPLAGRAAIPTGAMIFSRESLGSISGPYLTTLVVALGLAWHRIFPIFAAVTLLTLLLALVLSASESAPEDRPASVAASFALLKEPPVALAVLGIFLYVGAEVGLNSWLATFLARSFGMDLASSATRLGPGLFFVRLLPPRSPVLNRVDALRFFRASSARLSVWTSCGRSAVSPAYPLGSVANIWPLFRPDHRGPADRSGALGLMCMAIFSARPGGTMGVAADRAVSAPPSLFRVRAVT
jgi:hypothetical protein